MRKLTELERLTLENQHIILYALRNSAPNKIVYQTVQDQMIKARGYLDRDDMMERNK